MNVYDKVIEIISEALIVDEIEVTADSDITDLGADSLDVIDIIVKCEKEFDINIPHEDEDKFSTVGNIVEYIEKRIKGK